VGVELCVLGSGSSGNATLVASDRTALLIDAGLSCRQTELRLQAIGRDVRQVQAICLSHEHDDHTRGLPVVRRRFQIPLYANAGTIEGLPKDGLRGLPWNVFATGHPFRVGDLHVEPFSVPHDAYDPVGFVIHDNHDRVGVVTDLGVPTGLIRERLGACRAVVVEANHDEALLQEAERPWSLKQRIRGRQGHLSNAATARFVAEMAGPQLERVYLAHLSSQCNRAELALACVSGSLSRAGLPKVAVELTYPDRVSAVWSSREG
jgi:phosphoribosyl 1,2-cyclic phosphodiesterase